MAKRIQTSKESYDPVSQKYLEKLSAPVPPSSSTPSPSSPTNPVVAKPEQSVTTKRKRLREKRVLLTDEEERLIEEQVDRLARELQTKLKLSHVLRAFLILFRRADAHLLVQAQQTSNVVRPHNGDSEALEQFEKQIAEILARAIHETSSSS